MCLLITNKGIEKDMKTKVKKKNKRVAIYINGKRKQESNWIRATKLVWLLLKPFRWIVWVLWILFVCIAEATWKGIKEGLKEIILSLIEASSMQGKK